MNCLGLSIMYLLALMVGGFPEDFPRKEVSQKVFSQSGIFPSGKHPANFLKIFFKYRAKSVEV